MDTADDSAIEVTTLNETTDPDAEVNAMFERVRTRLGLQPSRREMLGRYELHGKRIGAGGMGSVYRAYDAELDRDVAIKVVSTRSLTQLDKLRQRLRREAKLLAKLEHPHVVRVYDSGVDEGRVYLAMELVVGDTLRARQANEPYVDVLRLYVEAGRGLAAIHAQGIVHRDFKPDNVFVGVDGHARVGDFGLAYSFTAGESESERPERAREESEWSSPITATGEILGTLGYMAPEQLRGDSPDARSDQYSFCVSLWEALAGVRPFGGATREAHVAAQESGEPQGGRPLRRRVRQALRVGLSAQPDDRHASMDALVEALERVLRSERERPRRRLVHGAFGLLVAATLATGVFGWRSYRAANPDCPLAEAVASALSTEAWRSLPPALIPRFEAHLETLESNAREACRTDDLARKQQIGTLLHSLELTLERLPEYEPHQVEDFVVEFEGALASGPTQPLTPDVQWFIHTNIEPQEADWAYSAILQQCTEGLEHVARSDVDRTELLLRRGRAYSFNGDPELAVADFKMARGYAVAARDEERELRANLAAAKTTTMRIEQIDAGGELLDLAEDLLEARDERWLSPRRAELFQLSASIAKRRGNLDEALALQWKAVWRRALVGPSFEFAASLVNLGSIHKRREEFAAARRVYRLALRLDPDDPEAQVNLGILLVNQAEDLDEARRLLTKVLDGDNRDLYVAAALARLHLEITDDGTPEVIAERRRDLVHRLATEPGTPTTRREGWTFVVLALAVEGNLGAEFDAAWGQLGEPQTVDQQLERASLEVNVADFLTADHPERAFQFLDRASDRIEPLPASPEREELLTRIRDSDTR